MRNQCATHAQHTRNTLRLKPTRDVSNPTALGNIYLCVVSSTISLLTLPVRVRVRVRVRVCVRVRVRVHVRVCVFVSYQVGMSRTYTKCRSVGGMLTLQPGRYVIVPTTHRYLL